MPFDIQGRYPAQHHSQTGGIDLLHSQQRIGTPLEDVIIVTDLDPIADLQTQATVPAQIFQGHRVAVNVADGKGRYAVILCPFERRRCLFLILRSPLLEHGSTRALPWLGCYAGTVNLHAVELVLEATVARLGGGDAWVAISIRGFFSLRLDHAAVIWLPLFHPAFPNVFDTGFVGREAAGTLWHLVRYLHLPHHFGPRCGIGAAECLLTDLGVFE